MSGFIDIITTLGYVGIIAVIFAESGLLFGFIFPGDSLLFAVGCFLAAVAGDSFGYWFGRRLGPRIFTKEDSFFFHKRHIEKTAKFYERYGKKTVLLARVMPIVRTFAPIFAGVGKMPYKVFFFYNVMGGFIWTFGFLFLAYFLGSTVPAVSEYLKWIILGIVLTSFIPVLIEYRQDRK